MCHKPRRRFHCRDKEELRNELGLTAGGCLALDKGGNDFRAFEDLFYLLIEQCQTPSCRLGTVRGQ